MSNQKIKQKPIKNEQINFSIFQKKKWKLYFRNLNCPGEENNFFFKNSSERKKEILVMNQELKQPELSPFFFRPWIKKRFSSTTRQKYLKTIYEQYNSGLDEKEQKDFFKSFVGEILKTTFLYSPSAKGLWLSNRILHQYQIKHKTKILKKVPWSLVEPHEKQYWELRNSVQKGWLYENLLKQTSKSTESFSLEKPYSAFQHHHKQQGKEPWVDPLVFKRWAYFGFIERNRRETRNRDLQLKPYSRKRNPRFEKRNKLYWWRQKLLFNFFTNNQIKKHKAKRIQQVLKKIYLPFYGNFNQKQWTNILKENKKKKSQFLNKNENLLCSLENRLDVVVYRLNLAPSILWARRLIQEGSVYVSNSLYFQNWISMYSQFKKINSPLKLRDPKSLYKVVYWDPNRNISKFKYLTKAVKKINYIVQPGEIIQSTKTLAINKLKSNTRLFKKPITKNFYTVTQTKHIWKNSVAAPKTYSFFKWREPTEQKTAALFLYNSRFTDLNTNDRAQELFFRWITL